MQADAFSGYNALYEKGREPAPVVEAACWAHGRRDVFDVAKLTKAPIAIEIMRRIDELFAIEREINGKLPEVRRAVRQARSKPLVAALEAYMREQLGRLSPKNDLAKAIRYMMTRWPSFTRFLDNGRICLSNNAAERALRCVAVGRRNWTFAGSDAGGKRAAAVYSLIRDVQAHRRRSERLARRRPRQASRSSRTSRRRTLALGLEGPPRSRRARSHRHRRVAESRAACR